MNIIDEYPEGLAMRVGRSCNADQVVAAIEALVAERERRGTCAWTTDPSSPPWALRDWCRISDTTTTYIQARLALGEPLRESFNGRVETSC